MKPFKTSGSYSLHQNFKESKEPCCLLIERKEKTSPSQGGAKTLYRVGGIYPPINLDLVAFEWIFLMNFSNCKSFHPIVCRFKNEVEWVTSL